MHQKIFDDGAASEILETRASVKTTREVFSTRNKQSQKLKQEPSIEDENLIFNHLTQNKQGNDIFVLHYNP